MWLCIFYEIQHVINESDCKLLLELIYSMNRCWFIIAYSNYWYLVRRIHRGKKFSIVVGTILGSSLEDVQGTIWGEGICQFPVVGTGYLSVFNLWNGMDMYVSDMCTFLLRILNVNIKKLKKNLQRQTAVMIKQDTTYEHDLSKLQHRNPVRQWFSN